jgi:sulfite reductase beta subunit-like hemoprotein
VIAIVYCGGCNPHVDRTAIADALPRDETHVRAGATVFLSGCPRACASQHTLVGDDPATVQVAGELLDGIPTPLDELAAAIARKLKE